MNDSRVILPGHRVRAWNHRHSKFGEATVLCRYGVKSIYFFDVVYDEYGGQHGEPTVWFYPDLVDLLFDDDRYESRGHFTKVVEVL